MREYRGKRVDNGEWVEGFYVKDEFGESLIFTGKCPAHKDYPVSDWECFVVIPETVGQHTGLYDKDKTPIYDGDYVFNPNDENKYYEIMWDEEEGGWSLGKDGCGLNKFQLSEFWQVKGNRFNPELLHKDK